MVNLKANELLFPLPPPPQNFHPNTIWTGYNLYVMRGMNSAPVDLIYLYPHSIAKPTTPLLFVVKLRGQLLKILGHYQT